MVRFLCEKPFPHRNLNFDKAITTEELLAFDSKKMKATFPASKTKKWDKFTALMWLYPAGRKIEYTSKTISICFDNTTNKFFTFSEAEDVICEAPTIERTIQITLQYVDDKLKRIKL